jgi:hypothetical protein
MCQWDSRIYQMAPVLPAYGLAWGLVLHYMPGNAAVAAMTVTML